MSRIDQALLKTHGTAPLTADDAHDNPWAVSAAPVPPAALPVTPAEVELSAPATPMRAEVPAMSPPVHQAFDEKVVTRDLAPAVVEEYRRLGALLHHMHVERNVRVVMMTSAVAGEGKSLTSVNLALTLSGSYGRNVLLIDADLRRPTLHSFFNAVPLTGLGDMLRDPTVTPPIIQVTPRLSLLTAGRPDDDPMGGLTSDRMRHLLEEAKRSFEFVLIDTPPVGLLTDANLLAAMVDVTFLVVRAGATSYDLVKRAVDSVGRHRIAGIVLNRAAAQTHDTHSYADYYGGYAPPRQA